MELACQGKGVTCLSAPTFQFGAIPVAVLGAIRFRPSQGLTTLDANTSRGLTAGGCGFSGLQGGAIYMIVVTIYFP